MSGAAGELDPRTRSLGRKALVVGVVALALCALVGAFVHREQLFRAYLLGYLVWLGVALGCVAVLMIHHLVGGAWGYASRRVLESGARTLPVLALLFVPLAAGIGLGLHELYPWADPAVVASDHVLQQKTAYLNVPFFLGRAGFYFLVWLALAWLLVRWSTQQDRDAGSGGLERLRLLGGPGLILYGLTVTFAAFDWGMSLEPHWFSTIYGCIYMTGQGIAALALVIVTAALLARGPLEGKLDPKHFHDLGNLLLAFVMLWAYVTFSQYLIIWSGNLPEEIAWYLPRTGHGWQWIAVVLMGLHFAVPFLVLLSRQAKRHRVVLATVAAVLLAARLLDLYWLLMPAFHPESAAPHAFDVLLPLALGLVWVGWFVRGLDRAPLLARNDPRFSPATAKGV